MDEVWGSLIEQLLWRQTLHIDLRNLLDQLLVEVGEFTVALRELPSDVIQTDFNGVFLERRTVVIASSVTRLSSAHCEVLISAEVRYLNVATDTELRCDKPESHGSI